ncbi:MAG: hypothetical protein OXU73_02140 [Candidatus Campbellbacteria bacterium]|nr:hypothetical protein [Candidatus Campbellbacteria bacterium]
MKSFYFSIIGMIVILGVIFYFAGSSDGGSGSDKQSRAKQNYDPATATEDEKLAFHLDETGSIFYGAFWCPACESQKNMFDDKGQKLLPYVECSLPNRRGQYPVCDEAGVRSYPTWHFTSGLVCPSVLTKGALAVASGYNGYTESITIDELIESYGERSPNLKDRDISFYAETLELDPENITVDLLIQSVELVNCRIESPLPTDNQPSEESDEQ